MSFELHSHIKNHFKKIDKFKMLHRKRSIRIIDDWVMIVGVLSPLTSLPQIVQILETKDSEGVSILTWLLYVVLAAFWLIYGIAHKEKVIIVNNLLWIILELVIVALVIIYK